MKLVCHIGTPKTASTFLQNTFSDNPEWLARHGVVYPKMLSHNTNHITLLYVSEQPIGIFARGYGIKDEEEKAAFTERLRQTIADQVAGAPAGTHTMLMSSENLTGNMRLTGIRNLHAFLSPFFEEIRIVLYLRPQDEAILSMYAEFMRKGFSDQTFADFAKHAMNPNAGPPYLFTRRLLKEWSDVFGQDAITVRLFDRARMEQGDILRDFVVHGLGIDDSDLSGLVPSPNNNPSLSAPALEFLRRLQPALPFARDGQTNPRRARLGSRIAELPQTPRPYMAAAMSQRILSHFETANEWVRETFRPDLPAPLFPPRDNLPEKSNLGQITLDEFAQLAGILLR